MREVLGGKILEYEGKGVGRVDEGRKKGMGEEWVEEFCLYCEEGLLDWRLVCRRKKWELWC